MPEVILSKLVLLQKVLLDLRKHISLSRAEQEKNHYEIERQIQIAVDLSIAIGRRMLAIKELIIPDTGKEIFDALANEKIIPTKLAITLGKAVGLRNILVHEYEIIDNTILFKGLKPGYLAFTKFAQITEKFVRKNKK